MCNETEMYKTYEKMINTKTFEIAHRFHRDLNEAKSLVMDVFHRVVNDYNPDLGAFSTYFYASCSRAVRVSVKEIANENLEVSLHSTDQDGNEIGDKIPSQYATSRSLEISMSAETNLSKDAQRVLSAIYDGTFEAGRVNASLPKKRYIAEYAKEYWDWNYMRGINAFEEIAEWYHAEIV